MLYLHYTYAIPMLYLCYTYTLPYYTTLYLCYTNAPLPMRSVYRAPPAGLSRTSLLGPHSTRHEAAYRPAPRRHRSPRPGSPRLRHSHLPPPLFPIGETPRLLTTHYLLLTTYYLLLTTDYLLLTTYYLLLTTYYLLLTTYYLLLTAR